MQPTHIEQVKFTQAQELLTISRATFVATYADKNDPKVFQTYLDRNFTLAHIKAQLEQSESTFFFAKRGKKIIGYIKLNTGVAQSVTGQEEGIEIERIYVLEAYKGQKIGQQMLKKAKEQAEKKNCPFIWLGVWKPNTKAIAFYEKMGFKKVGEHTFMMGDEAQQDWIMRLDLPTI